MISVSVEILAKVRRCLSVYTQPHMVMRKMVNKGGEGMYVYILVWVLVFMRGLVAFWLEGSRQLVVLLPLALLFLFSNSNCLQL